MPNPVRVMVPAGPITLDDPVALADGAVAAGLIHPRSRDRWLTKLARGGTVAATAITTLLALHPADPATRAAWARQARASSGQEDADADAEQTYRALYPTDEQAAVMAERRGREPDRLAQVATRQAWLAHNAAAARDPWGDPVEFAPAAAGDGDPDDLADDPHHEVIDHPPTTTAEHDHILASYQGGTHRHPHGHEGDHSHAPEPPNHVHGEAPADPVKAGIAARADAEGFLVVAEDDAELYRTLFGD